MAESTCGMVIDILNIYLPESKLSQLLGVACSILCLLDIGGIALFHLLHHLNRLLLVQSIGQVTVGNASQDRKSTRLNSSHVAISYAVFCLKKKKATQPLTPSQLLQTTT